MPDSPPTGKPATGTPATGTRWTALFLILFAASVGAAQLGKLPGALPEIRADLGIGLVTAGWIISTIVLIGALASIAAGIVGDRVGHRRVLFAGTALLGLGSLAGAAATGTSLLIASRVVEGFGYIALITAAPVLVARSSRPADRPVAFGIYSFYMPFGMSAMVALSPLVMAGTGGWRGLWVVNGLLALIAFAVLRISLRGPRFGPLPTEMPVAIGGIARTVTRAGPWTLAVGMGCYSLVYLSAMAFLPTFLIERQGFDAVSAGVLVGFAIFMNAPGCFVGGWMLKRGIPAWTGIAIAYAGLAASAFGLYLPDIPFALRYGFAIALPFFGGLVPPIVLSRAQIHAPAPALYGTTVGLIIQLVSIGQFVGPPILAALVAASGNWQSGAWLTVAACTIGLATAPVLRNLDRRAGLR